MLIIKKREGHRMSNRHPGNTEGEIEVVSTHSISGVAGGMGGEAGEPWESGEGLPWGE